MYIWLQVVYFLSTYQNVTRGSLPARLVAEAHHLFTSILPHGTSCMCVCVCVCAYVRVCGYAYSGCSN